MTQKEIEGVLGDISKIVIQYTDMNFLKNSSGDVLSYISVRLAALKASLIDVKVDAHREMLRLEVEMDRQKAIAYKKALKETNATAAKDGKYDDADFIKAREAYNEAKVTFEKLKSIVADSHDLIDSIKSRVIDMQGARRDERS